MIKVENVDVWGFEHAIRGMRNPKNSWKKSDSYMCDTNHCGGRCCHEAIEEKDCNQPDGYHVGKNDLGLMKRLYKSGTEHRTYARMIQCSMDIIAPLFWWKEMDRYTVGKSQVSCSTMHKIAEKEFELDDFSIDDFEMLGEWKDAFSSVVDDCERLRQAYKKTKDKRYWRMLIQLLPSSYNQRRTICMSYETVFKIIKERTGHKLDEWNDFVEVLKDLPYVREIIEDE